MFLRRTIDELNSNHVYMMYNPYYVITMHVIKVHKSRGGGISPSPPSPSLMKPWWKLRSSGEGGTDDKDKDLPVCTCMCGSAHDCGCVVDGSNAMVAL